MKRLQQKYGTRIRDWKQIFIKTINSSLKLSKYEKSNKILKKKNRKTQEYQNQNVDDIYFFHILFFFILWLFLLVLLFLRHLPFLDFQ